MKLRFAICGVEHSGTTLVSDLFRQVPGLDSGFEVGVLLGERPADFPGIQPFAGNMKAGWGITDADMEVICASPTFDEFYRKLGETSTVIDKNGDLFDKTPRYLAMLGECMQRARVPFIATYKDPRSIVFSDFQRAKTDDFDAWYDEYHAKKIGYMKTLYANYVSHRDDAQVEFASLEDLSVNTENTLKRLFNHVGVEFDYSYLLLKNLRYKNTHSNFIDMRTPFKYMEAFDKTRCRRIAADFAQFDEWFHC